MKDLVAIIGYGPVGRDAAERLPRAERRCASRSASDLPIFRPAPSSSPATRSTPPRSAPPSPAPRRSYCRSAWPIPAKSGATSWPKIMTNIVDACAASGARLVFFDNLYMYGPCTAPMKETEPAAAFGLKPAARAEATRIWMRASAAGRLKVAALACARFLRARRRAVRARRLRLRRARQGQGGELHRFARPAARFRLCAGLRARRRHACWMRPTTPSAAPGTSPARRPAPRAKFLTIGAEGDRRKASHPRPARCGRSGIMGLFIPDAERVSVR